MRVPLVRHVSMGAAILVLALASTAHSQATSDYDRGVAARLAGQIDVAVELLRRAAAADPNNADAQLQFGLALLAAGRLEEAERAFRTALDLAPGYDDARIGLARVHQGRGGRAAALSELDRVGVGNVEASELRAALLRPAGVPSPYSWRVDLDGSYSDVRSQSDWRDVSLRIAHLASSSTQVGAAIEQSHRFGRNDTYGELRVDHRASDRASLWLIAGGTLNADFRPRWQMGAGGAFKLTDGPYATIATIDARHARYSTGSIAAFSPGVEQYVAGGYWITARMINVVEDGNWHSGWLARADVLASARMRLFAGVADAPDVTEGVVVDTFSIFGGLVVDLNERTALRLSLNHEDRDGGADRIEFATGLGLRF